MPYFFILTGFVLYVMCMGIALAVASVWRPLLWLRPYLATVLLWSSIGFVVSLLAYVVVLVVAVRAMNVSLGGNPSVIGGVVMGGLIFIAPFIAAGGGLVGGAALGIWRRWARMRRAA